MLLLLSLSSPAAGATLTVAADGSGDHTTIQDAIDAASSGDTIFVSAGTWVESLDAGGKDLTLSGAGAPEDTELSSVEGDTVLTASASESIALESLTLADAGRGALIDGGALALTDVIVTRMSGDLEGAGLHLTDATLSCTRCYIERNDAGESDGGGLYLERSTATFEDAEITGNSAFRGGAIYALDSGVEITDSAVAENAASGVGGGVALWGEGDASLTRVEVRQNTSGGYGGALLIDAGSSASLSANTFDRNGAGGDGGAVHARGSFYAQYDDYLDNSAGGDGGAIHAEDTASFKVVYGDFQGNAAVGSGGGLSLRAAPAVVNYSDFTENSASTGGGIRASAEGESSAFQATDVTFSANAAESGGGAGLRIVGASSFAVEGSTFSDHASAALYASGTEGELTGSSFLGNEDGATFDGVTGGSVQSCAFLGNNDFGMQIKNAGSIEVANTVFLDNGGTGLRVSDSAGEPQLVNLDLVGNNRGLVLGAAGDAVVINTIAVGNASDGFSVTGEGADITYSDAWGNGTDWTSDVASYPGSDGNLSADPQYTGWTDDGDPTNDVLLIASGSPCRDAGDPDISDIDGSRSDMGSYGGPGAGDGDFDGDGHTLSGGDCDDYDASVHPGGEDTWYDGVDGDCAGDDDYDADGDGWRDPSSGDLEYDCDDTDATIYPGAPDDVGDAIDQDCDGVDGVYDPSGPGDRDGDGFSVAQGDCNEDDPSVHPDAAEICDDGRDNDCDTWIDARDDDCDDGGCGCAAGGVGGAWMWWIGVLVGWRRR